MENKIQKVRALPRDVYQKVEPYIPETSQEGKGLMYAAIGIGTAAGIGAIGYGLSNLITGANPANTCGANTQCSSQMGTCDQELNSLTTQLTALTTQFNQADAAQGIAWTTQQQQLVNQNIQAQNAVFQNCVNNVVNAYHLDWLTESGLLISGAIALAITIIAGAKALSYIKGKGYLKKPPKTPPGGGMVINAGLLDWMISQGIVPSTWKQGKSTVQSNASTFQQQVSNYTQTLVQQNMITSETAAAMLAADTALIAEDEALVLAVLA